MLIIAVEETGADFSAVEVLCLVAILKMRCFIHLLFIASLLRIPAFSVQYFMQN